MISSDVEAAPRSLADQLSDFSQRFDQEQDPHGHHHNHAHETSSQKVGNQSKLTPATYRMNTQTRHLLHGGPGAESRTDVNSVAITAKPSPTFYQRSTAQPQKQFQSSYTNSLARKHDEINYASQGHPQKSVVYDELRAPQPSSAQKAPQRSYVQPSNHSKAEMDLQLRELEYKLGASDRKNEEVYTDLHQSLGTVQATLREESTKIDQDDNQLDEMIASFESQLNAQLLKQKHARKEMSSVHLKAMDEQSFQLTLELAKIKKVREESEQRYGFELGDFVQKVAQQVEQEKLVRQENFSKLAERLQSETIRVQEMVALEKKVREETQGTLVRLIEELETNLGREIQAETDERVENEESFIQLLEQTCARVESNMHV